MRSFVQDALTADQQPQAEELAAQVPAIYRTHGRLLHDGTLNTGDSFGKLSEIMRAVLKAVMKRPDLVDGER